MRTTFKNIYKTEIQEVEKAMYLNNLIENKSLDCNWLKNKINEQVEEASCGNVRIQQKKVQEKIDELTAKYEQSDQVSKY